MDSDFFDSFDLTRVASTMESSVTLCGRGPPLLLLHGNPQTH
ncbi:MAG: hypothetical protein Ct9H300mP16_16310 [Pseudomonadota bacterium]|nr:MAG: hypothetical protein Ct9H300mP16_16310 [Pseudomonadota bacterium]